MGEIYANLGQYAKAIEYCDKATEADITTRRSAANLKAQIQRNQANQAANEKLQKAYQDFIQRQKAEEAFWNKGRK